MIFCFTLLLVSYIITLCIKGPFFVTLIYLPSTPLAVNTILNLPFSSNHLIFHFLLIPFWLILHVNNIVFFLQSLKERNEILRNDSANINIYPQGDHRRQRASCIVSTILRYP